MRKVIVGILGLTVLLCLFGALGATTEALAGVEVNVNIGPPPIVVAEPPEVVLVPGSQVYFVPQPGIDVFFYSGYWWSPRGDRWYRARAYNGPWVIVERRYVPAPVFYVPRDYRAKYKHEHHIPYGQWKKEYRHGEREEHRDWKEEGREHGEGHGHGHN